MIAVVPPVAVLLYPVEIAGNRNQVAELVEWNRRVRQFNKGRLR